jgi:hypothetical protein
MEVMSKISLILIFPLIGISFYAVLGHFLSPLHLNIKYIFRVQRRSEITKWIAIKLVTGVQHNDSLGNLTSIRINPVQPSFHMMQENLNG